VAQLARTLFDLAAPMHHLAAADRRLLRLAAVVHDVGRCNGADGHAADGARLLLADMWLPLSAAERRALAYLTRYHRGAVPKLGEDDVLRPGDDHRRLRVMLALLRAADALDSRAVPTPRLVFALRGRRLHAGVYLAEDSAKARKVYGRRKKLKLLEAVLGCHVDVEIRVAEALALAA
jgi:exopolyphosphatase/guanosine-5'-triphosphate,3'-diphosphate pyrophosphatase